MNEVFDLIYRFLKWLSTITGLTYHEVNIVVYFILIPAFAIFLVSLVFRNKYLILGYLVIVALLLLIIPDFQTFSDHLFEKSVALLNWFENLGLNYVQASVVICVILPSITLTLLLYFSFKLSKT